MSADTVPDACADASKSNSNVATFAAYALAISESVQSMAASMGATVLTGDERHRSAPAAAEPEHARERPAREKATAALRSLFVIGEGDAAPSPPLLRRCLA
jgi:hypothetical protein